MKNPKIELSDGSVLDFNNYKISFEPSWELERKEYASVITGKKKVKDLYSEKGRFKAKIIVYDSDSGPESLSNYTEGEFYFHSDDSEHFKVNIINVQPFKAGTMSGLIRNTLIEIESQELVENPIQCDAPDVQPPSQSFENGGSVQITMSTTVLGGKIYYTTDGSEPDETDNLYTNPFSVDSTTTIKARVYRENMRKSEVVTRQYTENPPA